MPRHQHAQSAAPPVPTLNAEEMKFWLKIMEEHAVFIKAGLPCDQCDLIEEAKSFQQEFKTFRVKAEKIQSEKKYTELTLEVCRSLKEYIRYKRLLLCRAVTGKLQGGLYPSFLDHLVREAEYFMSLLTRIKGKTLEVIQGLEVDFWLRIMDNHAHFIRHLLDPSERSIINVSEGYVREFDALGSQAHDFSSMLKRQTVDFPVFDRFLKDSRTATMRFRDFKRAIYEMICSKKLLTLMPHLMADHIRREAEHFLLVLAMIEKCVVKQAKHDDVSLGKYAQCCPEPMEFDENCEQFAECKENFDSCSDVSSAGFIPDFDCNTGHKPPKFTLPKKYVSHTKKGAKFDKEVCLEPAWIKNPANPKRDDEQDIVEEKYPKFHKSIEDEKPEEYEEYSRNPLGGENSLSSAQLGFKKEQGVVSDSASFEQSLLPLPDNKPTHLEPRPDSSQPNILKGSSVSFGSKYKQGTKWPRQLGKISG